MAPAVLANLNQSSFQRKRGSVFMRKYTNQPLSVDFNDPLLLLNPNPNLVSNNSNKHFNNDLLPCGDYVSFDLDGYTANQLKELKKRFNFELEQVRFLRERIESGTFVSGSAPARSFSGETNDVGVKKTKKRKIGQGQKRSNTMVLDLESEKALRSVMSTCGQILGKLMKHKWSWVFNKPVDVLGLGLHDYHLIVKKPMDLGTVKLNLDKGFYGSPIDFASDVRLTFTNAMAYNPKHQDVYLMAEKLLSQFDVWFSPALKRFESLQVKVMGSSSRPEPELKETSWIQNHNQIVENVKKGPEQISIAKKLDSVKPLPTLSHPVMELPRVPSPPSPAQPALPSPPPSPQPPPRQPVRQVEPPLEVGETTKGRKGKLPKPKAKDPNKRQMTMEEKAKLGVNLQELPPEKLGQLIQILNKRTRDLPQDGDEIELDIEALDNETLWELDRFVTNYKKMASKIKRQGFIQNVSTPLRNMPMMTEMASAEKKGRKGGGDAGEEDVDIGDDIPIEDYPTVEIERDGTSGAAAVASGGSGSSGGSSSSGSSSTSDSESGSSSGSDSDADSVQSPFVAAKEAP